MLPFWVSIPWTFNLNTTFSLKGMHLRYRQIFLDVEPVVFGVCASLTHCPPGGSGCHFNANCALDLQIHVFTSFKDALRWMPWDLTDDKSAVVLVMFSYRQPTSHYLSQWWRRSLSPHGDNWPQCVNSKHGCNRTTCSCIPNGAIELIALSSGHP